MKKILSNKNFCLIFVTLLSFIFLLSSYIPNFYEASVVELMPQDRVMLWGEHVYTYDYNVYLSKIRQGIEGRWLVVDKYDNHPNQKGALLQMLYLSAGKLGGIFRFDPALTFHLLRTVLSIAWVFTIIYLNIYFLKKPLLYTVGILFSLLAASWPIFYRFQDQWWVGMHMGWWQEMDVLKRISYLPHYLLNYIIIALFTILLTKLNNKNFIYICLLVFISFFVHPAGGILFLISWFLYHFLKAVWFRSYNKRQIIDVISYSIILCVVAAIPVLYLQFVTSTYPWKSLVDFDTYNRVPVDVKDYILALGPVFFTGILGLLLVLRKKEEKYLSLVTWILAAFLAIYVFKKFPYEAELRFIQTANHIPLAILSAYFLFQLLQKWPRTIIKVIIVIIVITIISLGVVQSYFSIKGQIDFIHQRAVAVQPLVPYPPQVMYPLKDFWNALKWLETNTNHNAIVLSQYTAGNYIPAYSGDFVYFGHNPETPFYAEREPKLNNFFSGLMEDKDAYNFLKTENISYVFYGPQEKEKSVKDISKYKFIRQVFSTSYVTVFKVTK